MYLRQIWAWLIISELTSAITLSYVSPGRLSVVSYFIQHLQLYLMIGLGASIGSWTASFSNPRDMRQKCFEGPEVSGVCSSAGELQGLLMC